MRGSARPLFFYAAVVVVTCVAAAPARAADRWVRAGTTLTRGDYYQGITHDGAGRLYFDGVSHGGYRTDLALREQARNENLIPPSEPFNHIGDWSFDSNEGGRLILPLECYTPGAPNGGNTCGIGALGVADPRTMTWRYRVLLDGTEIPKAMWAEVSPDGKLVWTSTGPDLIAYSTADISPANAGGAVIHPVRRLSRAVPPSGITGATFVGQRLFVAGQNTGRFDVWSIDTTTGARRREISQRWAGESEGLAYVDAFGGALQWQVQPFDPQGRPPTFGSLQFTVVSFVRRADARLRVRAVRRPGGRVRATVTLRFGGRDHPVKGATVMLGGQLATTTSRGRATLRARRGAGMVLARKPPLVAGKDSLG